MCIDTSLCISSAARQMSQFRECCFSYAVAVAKSLLNVHGSDIVVVDKCQFASVEAYETERERERERERDCVSRQVFSSIEAYETRESGVEPKIINALY